MRAVRQVSKTAGLVRNFFSSAEVRAGSHGGHDDYVHATHMYNIMDMKNRKLKFGLGVASVVFGGMAIPLVACQWQFIKARG